MSLEKLKNLGLVWTMLYGAALCGQSTTGTVQGVVMDQQKALVPGVAVIVRSLETNAIRTTTSDSEGRYRIASLPIGAYELRAELAGFVNYRQSGVTIAVNQTAVVDITIQAGTVAQEVTVIEADAPPLNKSNAEVGVLFDRKRISDLPIASDRDVF